MGTEKPARLLSRQAVIAFNVVMAIAVSTIVENLVWKYRTDAAAKRVIAAGTAEEREGYARVQQCRALHPIDKAGGGDGGFARCVLKEDTLQAGVSLFERVVAAQNAIGTPLSWKLFPLRDTPG